MEDRKFQKIFLPISIVINLLFSQIALSAETKEKANQKSAAEDLLKKYSSYRPKETLYLKDSMSDERVNLDNEYFKISYPKCFKVEPTVEDSEDVTAKNSASIDFVRSKDCLLFNANEKEMDVNRMQLFYMSDYIAPKLIEGLEKVSKQGYRQLMDINGAEAVIYWGAGISPQWNMHGELISGWGVDVGCKGKKNERFHFSLPGQRNKDVIKMYENRKFELPQDFEQIISSFKCRKDR